MVVDCRCVFNFVSCSYLKEENLISRLRAIPLRWMNPMPPVKFVLLVVVQLPCRIL